MVVVVGSLPWQEEENLGGGGDGLLMETGGGGGGGGDGRGEEEGGGGLGFGGLGDGGGGSGLGGGGLGWAGGGEHKGMIRPGSSAKVTQDTSNKVCLHCPVDAEARHEHTANIKIKRPWVDRIEGSRGNTNSSARRIWRWRGTGGQAGWWR